MMSLTRRVALALSLGTLAAACAGHAPRPSGAATAAAESGEPGPLAARLLPPWHQMLRFVLSAPAYVTVFEIVPGHGVSIVYPAPFQAGEKQAVLGPGSHTVHAVPYNVGRWFYSDTPLATSGPTYLYMIASREPLEIDQVLKNPASLRRVVGFAKFMQSNEQRTMDALDERFVPRHLDDDAWASDWIALWPDPALDDSPVDARLLMPTCGDGMVVVAVPGPTPGYICARRQTKEPPPPHKPTPSDSSASAKPPTDTTAPPARPSDGKGPAAPKKTRTEPPSLAVDYGVPSETASGDEGAPRQRTPRRAERPWERGAQGSLAEREAYQRPPRDEYVREPRRRSAERGQETEVGGRSPDGAGMGARSEPRSEPRTEPRSAPRTEPRMEPRSERRSEPSSSPRGSTGAQ